MDKRQKKFLALAAGAAAVIVIILLIILIPGGKSNEAKSASADDYSSGCYLVARENTLPETAAAEVVIALRVPQTEHPQKVQLTNSLGKKLGSYKLSELTPAESGNFLEYALNVSIPKAGKNETAVKITADVDGKKTVPVTLYREVHVGEREMKTMCDVLDLAGEYVDSIYDEISTEKDAEKVRQKTVEYLRKQNDVREAWIEENGRVCFVTNDGMLSAVDVQLTPDNPEESYAGSGVTTGISQLSNHFKLDPDFILAMYDPDVFVCCPLRETTLLRNGINHEAVGRQLAAKYEGDFSLSTDKSDASDPFFAFTSPAIDQYGTVILTTHGSYTGRSNGTQTVDFRLYQVKKKDRLKAYDIWAQFTNHQQTATAEGFYNYEAGENRSNGAGGDNFQMILVYDSEHKVYYISVTTNYLMDCWRDCQFPNTIFYLGACDSACDTEFFTFLHNHGAAATIGYVDPVYEFMENEYVKSFFKYLMLVSASDPTRNNTVTESLNRLLFNELLSQGSGLETSPTVYSAKKELITGNVFTAEHKPLEGINVHAYRYYDSTLIEEATAETNKSGEYVFRNLPWGMYLIQAENGKIEAFANCSISSEKNKIDDIELDYASIEITVKGKKDKDLRDAILTLIDEDDEMYEFESGKNDKGNFCFYIETLSPGKYYLSVACEKYETVNETLEIPAGKSKYAYKLNSRKGTPEDTVLKLERAQNKLDQEMLLECYAPQYTGLYNGMLGLLDGLTGISFTSISGMSQGLGDIYGLMGILPVVHYQIDDIQYSDDKETCIVYCTYYASVMGETNVEKAELPMQLYDDEWLISVEDSSSILSMFY